MSSIFAPDAMQPISCQPGVVGNTKFCVVVVTNEPSTPLNLVVSSVAGGVEHVGLGPVAPHRGLQPGRAGTGTRSVWPSGSAKTPF